MEANTSKTRLRKKSKKTFTGIMIILALLLIAGAAGGYMMFNSGVEAVSAESEEVVVTIENGSGYYQIIDTLNGAGLIKDPTMARVYVKFFAPENPQANTYVLNKNMDLETMLNIISTGDFNFLLKTSFTVIDGSTIPAAAASIGEALGFETDDILAKWSDEAFLKELISEYWFLTEEILGSDILYPLEGYIYPETYFVVDQEPTIESITRYCLDLMNEKLTPYQKRIEELGMTPHQFVALASVIQDESLFEKDYKTISGVFHNRLETGMPLQSDSTVLYAVQDKYINVSLADLEVDSRYNTYKYAGIPVGPICSVRAEILDACANYEEHNYYYFFAKEDGEVLYAETLSEHNRNVQQNLWY